MTNAQKAAVGVAIVAAAGAIGFVNVRYRRAQATEVTTEAIARRNLEAVVSASGKIRAFKSVVVSAEVGGRVTRIMVSEGERVTRGQPLLEIDARNLEILAQTREASLATARSQLEQTLPQVDSAKVALKQAEDLLRRTEQQWNRGLVSRDQYERAQNDVKARAADLRMVEQSVKTQEQRVKQEEANLDNARYDLTKALVRSPIDGIVVQRLIEVGETARVTQLTGSDLITVADLSRIETEIEVDETDVPFVRIGQPAAIEIDAFPDRTFAGRVTEVGNSPIAATGAAATARATNFKVVVQIDGEVPDVRPGFTCTAVITTATRSRALSVPIQSMTVRELIVDKHGRIVPPPAAARRSSSNPPPQEPGPGEERKEIEGVFLVRDGRAVFTPVKTGIAGEKYFEVLDGLKEGDQVITGPFASVRSLKDGDAVEVDNTIPGAAAGTR